MSLSINSSGFIFTKYFKRSKVVYLISNKNVSLPLLQFLHKQRSQERERLHEVLFGTPEVVEILFLRID
jgi:hypothetical protein